MDWVIVLSAAAVAVVGPPVKKDVTLRMCEKTKRLRLKCHPIDMTGLSIVTPFTVRDFHTQYCTMIIPDSTHSWIFRHAPS